MPHYGNSKNLYLYTDSTTQHDQNSQTLLEITSEEVLVLFLAETSLRSGLRTFFVTKPDHAKHFR